MGEEDEDRTINFCGPSQGPVIGDYNFVIQNFVSGLTILPTEYASYIKNFLLEYLGTPTQPTLFGGREIELAELDRWLADPAASPYRFLCAPAGRGKSALLVHWSKRLLARDDQAVIFMPVSVRFDTSRASVVFTSLVARLAKFWDEAIPNIANTNSDAIRATMSDYLNRPLPNGRQLLLILDGIDEAADWQVGPNLFPKSPPPGLRIIISARRQAGDANNSNYLRSLGWNKTRLADSMELPLLTNAGVADVLNNLNVSHEGALSDVEIAEEIYRLSEGDPLLVNFYAMDLLPQKHEAEPRLKREDLSYLKPGLEGYFDHFKQWMEETSLWGSKPNERSPLSEPEVSSFLSMLSCALGPMSKEDLLALAPVKARLNSWSLAEVIRPFTRLVVGDGEQYGYAFCHPKLATYFFEKYLTERERRNWEKRFVTWGRETIRALQDGQLRADEVSHYLIKNYGAHLERAGESIETVKALVSNEWRLVWGQFEDTHTGFLNDVTRVWRAAERTNRSEIREGRKAPCLDIEILCALCLASAGMLSVPLELAVVLVAQRSWSPQQAYSAAKNLTDPWLVEELCSYLPNPAREELLVEALRQIERIEWAWLRAEKLLALANSLPFPHRERAIKLAWEATAAIENVLENENKAVVLAKIASYMATPLAQETRQQAIELVLSQKSRVRGLSRLAQFFPDEEGEEILLLAEKTLREIDDPGDRVQQTLGLCPHLSPESQRRVIQSGLAAARKIEDAGARLEGILGLLPYFLSSEQEQIARDELTTAESVETEDEQAQSLIALAVYLPEPTRKLAIEEALSILRRPSVNISGDRLIPALSQLSDLGYKREVFAIANAINNERIQTEAWFELATHFGDELPEEVIQALETIKKNYLSPAVDFSFSQVRGFLSKLQPLIPESDYNEFLLEALKKARTINDQSQIAETLAALAHYSPEIEREELLRSALSFGVRIVKPSEVVDTLPKLSQTLDEPTPKEVYSKAFRAAQENPDSEKRFRSMVALLPHLPESEVGKATNIVLDQARAFASKEQRIKALVSVIVYLQHPVRQEVFNEIASLTRELEDPSWRVQHLIEMSFIVSEETRPLVVAEARASADQVKYATTGLMEELLLGNISRLARFGFHEEALRIIRSINDTFERACMLIAILQHVPEPKRQSVETEMVSTVQAVENVERRAWLLNLLVSPVHEPHRSQIIKEVENYAHSVSQPILRAAILVSLASQVTEEREKFLSAATELVLRNDDDQTTYKSYATSPLGYLLPLDDKVKSKDRGALLAGMCEQELRHVDFGHSKPARSSVIDALLRLHPSASRETLYTLLNEALHQEAGHRERLLACVGRCVPTQIAVGGIECLTGISQAVQDVGHWWP